MKSFIFRLHGGDNVQIKRYFVSFWNGVDLRYKLLKGPKIRISIAGIIISRVKCNWWSFRSSYQTIIVSRINVSHGSLVSFPFPLFSFFFFFFLSPWTISSREEMPRRIWKEIALDGTRSIRQLRWPTWANISSVRDDFRCTTSLSPSQSKSVHFFQFNLISTLRFTWLTYGIFSPSPFFVLSLSLSLSLSSSFVYSNVIQPLSELSTLGFIELVFKFTPKLAVRKSIDFEFSRSIN